MADYEKGKVAYYQRQKDSHESVDFSDAPIMHKFAQ